MKITIISSSVRIGRQSHQVAEELQRRIEKRSGADVSLIDLAEYELPLLASVLARHPNPPADVLKIGAELNKADAMIFVSPEYNGGYSSALKNLVDYFPKTTYADKPIALASVSSGGMGGMRGALQMQQLILALGGFPLPKMLLVSKVKDLFDDQRQLTDQGFIKKFDDFLSRFLWFVEAIVEKKGKLVV